jgi:hypothetical protein
MRLVHYIVNGAHVRILDGTTENVPTGARLAQFKGQATAPGGFGPGEGLISKAERDAHLDVYANGALWCAYDADDPDNIDGDGAFTPDRVTWVGRVTEAFDVDGANARLDAEGLAGVYERTAKHRLWQTYDLARWVEASSDPFKFNSHDQFTVHIHQQHSITLKVKRGQTFKRANGKTTLAEDAKAGDKEIQVRHNWGGLSDGEVIHIGSATGNVASSYSDDSTSIPLQDGLAAGHKAGETVSWTAPNTPDKWWGGVVWTNPTDSPQSVAVEIRRPRNTPEYWIEVCSFDFADAPHARLTVEQTIHVDGTDAHQQLVTIGARDSILVRIVRTTETRKCREFEVNLREVRVNDLNGGDDTYYCWQVQSDIAGFHGDGTAQIDHDSVNAMPLDGRGESDASIMDFTSTLSNKPWLRLHSGVGGSSYVRVKAWSEAVYHLAVEQFPVSLRKIKSYGHVTGPYKFHHGIELPMRVEPTTGPVVSDEDFEVQLDDPPHEEIAEIIYLNIANYVARDDRYSGVATATRITDPDGNEFPASRLKPGYTTVLDNYRSGGGAGPHLSLHVEQIEYQNDQVVITWPDGYPEVERYLAHHKLMVDRGRHGISASLHGLGIGRPAKPGGSFGYHLVDTRNGQKHFEGYASFAPVTLDIDGDPTGIDAYRVYWRYRHATTGVLIPENQGGGPFHRVVHARDDDDTDSGNYFAHFGPLAHPHEWAVEGVVRAVDVRGLFSPLADSDWSAPVVPAAFAPSAPNTLVQRVDQHEIKLDWNSDDATETDHNGNPMLAQGMGEFVITRYLNGVRYGKILHTRSTHKTWPAPKHTTADTLRTDIYARDHYGNVSATATISSGRGSPPAPVSAPGPATFDRGGKKGVRGKLPFTYSGTDTDFHIDRFIIEYQAEDHTPTGSDPTHRITHHVAITDYNLAQLVSILKLKAGEQFRARYYAQATKGGHLSAPSPYSTVQTVTAPKKPGKVSSRLIRSKTRGVLAKWTEPTAWDDGTTEGWTQGEIAYNIVSLTDSAGTIVNDSDGNPLTVRTRASHHFFALDPSEVGVAKGVKVDVYGWDETHVAGDSGASATQGSAAGLGVVAGDIPAGSIDYSKIAASMPASAAPGDYGDPVSDGATPPRYRLVSGPSGTWKTGDWVMNNRTAGPIDLKPHMYRYEGGFWYRVADESFYANTIVGGTLSGTLIQGNDFRTVNPAVSGSYIEMLTSAFNQINFYNASVGRTGQIKAGAGNIEIIGGDWLGSFSYLFMDSSGITLAPWPGGSLDLDASGADLGGGYYRRSGTRIAADSTALANHDHSHNITGRTGTASGHDHGAGTLVNDTDSHAHGAGHVHTVS